jgi:FkbM family methyltransferase
MSITTRSDELHGTGKQILKGQMEPSRIGEFITSRLAPDANGKPRGRIQRQVFSLARRILAQRNDRFIRYRLGGSEILLPLAHDLPLIRSVFPQYSTNIARLCSYVSEKYPDLHLVDIGANIGDTVAIIREFSQCPILCVEGDEYYYKILLENIQRAKFVCVETVRAFVATYTGEIQGQLVSVAGTAYFVEGSAVPVKTVKLSHLLEDFPAFQSAKILKIDTDGFDCSILRSELEWLGERRPAIFFEYDPFFFRNQPYDGARIFEDLSTVGYTFAIFYDNYGDYLTSVDLQQDADTLIDLQNYYVGRGGQQYADVAVFHREDRELAEHIRRKEAEWSLRSRKERLGGDPPPT